MSVLVHFVYSSAHPDAGIKGSYTAAANDIVAGINITKAQLISDLLEDNEIDTNGSAADYFTITKAEVV